MVLCESVQRALWSGEPGDDAAQGHVASCPDCATEAARADSLQTAMISLRDDVVAPPPDLYASILASLDAGWRVRARRVLVHPRFRTAAVGAAAAASAAAFVGVLVANRRARPGLAG
jgi:hypothetical protein